MAEGDIAAGMPVEAPPSGVRYRMCEEREEMGRATAEAEMPCVAIPRLVGPSSSSEESPSSSVDSSGGN